MVGNKSDLINEEIVSKEEAQNFAKEIGALFKYTSAKTGKGIDELFKEICIKKFNLNNKDNYIIDNSIGQAPTPFSSPGESFENDFVIINNKNEIEQLKNNNKRLEEQIKILKDELSKEKNINQQLNEKIKNLENKIEENKTIKNEIKSDNDNNKKIIELYEELRIKNKEIDELKKLKKRYPFELLENEKLMSVIFTSLDQKIHYSIICKNTDTFSVIEKLLYEEFPGYKNSENIFTVNGNKINRYDTLEENKIYNSDTIILKQNL